MKDWFAGLEPREQLFVSIGAVVVAIAVLWGLIWTPVNKSHAELRANVETWQRSLSELQPIKAAIQSGAGNGSAPVVDNSQSPLVMVDQTLNARGLNNTVKGRRPTPNGINVEFENVAFDDLVLWLGDLSSQYGMEVQSGNLSLASRAGPGRINATLTLERAL